jgi:hypothetical protein
MKRKTMNSKRAHDKKNVNLAHFSTHTHRGAHGGLFIGEIKGHLTLAELPLANHYISRVHSLRGITDYYNW